MIIILIVQLVVFLVRTNVRKVKIIVSNVKIMYVLLVLEDINLTDFQGNVLELHLIKYVNMTVNNIILMILFKCVESVIEAVYSVIIIQIIAYHAQWVNNYLI